jgi:hypothetical protein
LESAEAVTAMVAAARWMGGMALLQPAELVPHARAVVAVGPALQGVSMASLVLWLAG